MSYDNIQRRLDIVMKKHLLTLTLLFLLFIFPCWAQSATYYVAQTAAGSGDGSSHANWMSVSSHNCSTFIPGDVIYLVGTITSQLEVPSSGSPIEGYITYDGYEAGDGPRGAKISRRQALNVNGFLVDHKSYIIIQDLEVEECNAGLVVREGSHHITIKRCKIHDMLDLGMYFGFIATKYGGTGISCSNITIGGSADDGNELYDIGVGTSASDILFNSGHDIVISHNHLYASEDMSQGRKTDRGIDGIVMVNGVHDVLVEYNEIHGHYDEYWSDPTGGDHACLKGKGEDGIDIKELCYNIIVRYNNLYNNRQTGITVQSDSHDVYIYGNNLHGNNWGGIMLKDGNTNSRWSYNALSTRDVKIWSNVIYDNKISGIYITGACGNIESIYIYNNVLANNATLPSHPSHTGIRCDLGKGPFYIENNIFYNNRPNAGPPHYQQIYVGANQTKSTTIQANRFYWPSQTSTIHWSSGYVNATSPSIGSNNTHGDPGFMNAAKHDYTLTETSTCRNSATTLGGSSGSVTVMGTTYVLSYSDALLPTTDWRTTPSKVKNGKQENYGYWEKGAYIWSGYEVRLASPHLKLYESPTG